MPLQKLKSVYKNHGGSISYPSVVSSRFAEFLLQKKTLL